MPRLPSSIEAAETENMDFNTQSSEDIDESFHLSESGSAYSPSGSGSELESLGDFLSEGDECLQLSQTLSKNEFNEPRSPVMPSRRAIRSQSQRSRKKGLEEQRKKNN